MSPTAMLRLQCALGSRSRRVALGLASATLLTVIWCIYGMRRWLRRRSAHRPVTHFVSLEQLVLACSSLYEFKGLHRAPHEQGCEFTSWKVSCQGLVTGKRQKGRLLVFLSLVPPSEQGPPGEMQRAHSWVASAGEQMEVQAVCGQTLATELGKQPASALLKSIRVGQTLSVTGYPRRNRGKTSNMWALEVNATAVEVVAQPPLPSAPAPAAKKKKKRKTDLNLPEFVSAATTCFVNSSAGLRQVMQQLQDYVALGDKLRLVGLDCEWRPRCHGGTSLSPVSVLQLSIPAEVSIVLDLLILRSAAPAELTQLAKLLQQQCVIVGFGLQQDIERLIKSYPDLFGALASGARCLDVRHLAALQSHLGTALARSGLAFLAEVLLKMRVDKTCQISDWGCESSRTLSTEQIEYAGTDVAVLTPLLCAIADPLFDMGGWAKNEKVEYAAVMERVGCWLVDNAFEFSEGLAGSGTLLARGHDDVMAAIHSLGIGQVEVGTVEQLQQKLSGQTMVVAKTLVMQLTSGSEQKLVVAVCPLDTRLSMSRVARQLDVKPTKLRLLCADELVPMCGFPRGAMPLAQLAIFEAIEWNCRCDRSDRPASSAGRYSDRPKLFASRDCSMWCRGYWAANCITIVDFVQTSRKCCGSCEYKQSLQIVVDS